MGVVGRSGTLICAYRLASLKVVSGAGKSSLIAALFRTTEPCGGQLLIDGVDVMGLPLKTLRSCLAIVPQVGVMECDSTCVVA